MAPFGVSITKRVTWRGLQEEFSNVYHFDTVSPIDTEAGWISLVDQVAAAEKLVHDNEVTFVRARVWGPTDQGQAASVTRLIHDLSGAGAVAGQPIPFEQTIVGSFYIGRNPGTGRKRFLRKYYHVCGLAGTATNEAGRMGNSTLAQADRDAVAALMNDMKTVTVGGNDNHLCTPQGDHLPVGSDPVILPHLHIRQFRQ